MIPRVLLLKYYQFNSFGEKISKHDIKCQQSLIFKNTHYKLKGLIVHEGESIENRRYIGIILNNSNYLVEMVNPNNFKGYPNNLNLIEQAYVLLFESNGMEKEYAEQKKPEEENKKNKNKNKKKTCC